MNLEDVAGIIITPDGIPHFFGESDLKIGEVNPISHEEYFEKEVATSKWFKDLNIPYNKNNLYLSILDMTRFGLSFIINASNVSHNENDTFSYVIFTPSNLTDQVKEYFSNNYQELKNIIEKNNAFFQADIIRDGDYSNQAPFDNIDEFFQNIGIKNFHK